MNETFKFLKENTQVNFVSTINGDKSSCRPFENPIMFDDKIYIDDKVNNIEGATTKLLYTAWHNKDITKEELEKQNIIRVNNWKEIGKILLDRE